MGDFDQRGTFTCMASSSWTKPASRWSTVAGNSAADYALRRSISPHRLEDVVGAFHMTSVLSAEGSRGIEFKKCDGRGHPSKNIENNYVAEQSGFLSFSKPIFLR
ncbi:MAG TPA: hypothetical protein VGC27_08070 [Rhizomicrobium sp.]